MAQPSTTPVPVLIQQELLRLGVTEGGHHRLTGTGSDNGYVGDLGVDMLGEFEERVGATLGLSDGIFIR